jgi:hypothetical protein
VIMVRFDTCNRILASKLNTFLNHPVYSPQRKRVHEADSLALKNTDEIMRQIFLHLLQIALHVPFMTQCLHLKLPTCLLDNL